MQNIRRDLLESGICLLTFDRPSSSANIFDHATLLELDALLRDIPDAKGLILTSSKPSIFVAGADLRAIQRMNLDEVARFIDFGQSVFTRLAALQIPTVAAIHGACLGGGYELALACDWRVASPDRATKIGLPETKLGILPAWGGSTRLPRLIGVPGALDVILGGKTPGAREALKLGMIDEIAPRESLIRAATDLLARGKHPHSLAHSAAVNAVVDAVVAHKARADVQRRTRGNYPAIDKALDVILHGSAEWDQNVALARERQAIGELMGLDSTRNLMRLFFLQERAKKLSSSEPGAKKMTRAAVIGAGVMGAGIAQWLSARGLQVILRDVDAKRVAAGMATVARLFADGVKHRALTSLEARDGVDRISPAPVEVSLQHTDLVIEAAVEKMEVKKSIFRRLDEITRDDAVLATNTSALSISELAAATRHPSRVVGLHFFNPVHKMQLVEVVIGRETAPAVAQRVTQFVQQIGKLPVVVRDSPGFLVNRVLVPYLLEAAELFAAGADAKAIDDAMLDFGMPMGPLRLVDEVGIDVSADVAETLASAFPDRIRIPLILGKMTAAGLLGRKVGGGFFLHQKRDQTAVNPGAVALRTSASTPPEVASRLVLLMINEAVRCLDEKVVDHAADVDFGMVMGTGWAPFRGGPLRYADHLGAEKVTRDLLRFAEMAGLQYAPCERLVAMAKSNAKFYED